MVTKIIGHRGGTAGYPENTLINFRRAVSCGADGVELDVQMTKDGKVVVIHDELIDRTMNGRGLVKNYNLKELKKLNAGEYLDPKFNEEKIPTLNEVLEIAKYLPIINIELKNFVPYPGLEKKVLDILENHKIREKAIISSFNHHSLLKIKELDQEIKTGALFTAKMVEPVEYVLKHGFDALNIQFLTVDGELVKKAHANGIEVNVYTVNYYEPALELFQMGVDNIITDDIEMVKEARKSVVI
ncbi:MAG: glycerophosphodiester phosphodiesterase [Halanaerobiales bacterium]|nr:glycerophosphodiester phosphodiesterase [Halanaerobiales bacterium]